DIPWQATIATTSALALGAVPAILSVRAGRALSAAPPLDLGAAWRTLRRRPLRLTTGSYLGHMWELYAFWAWLPAFFAGSRAMAPGRAEAGIVAFAAIGVAGLAGCVLGGVVADRVGRTALTSVAMLVSAGCCVLSPLAFGAPALVLVLLLLIWGAA